MTATPDLWPQDARVAIGVHSGLRSGWRGAPPVMPFRILPGTSAGETSAGPLRNFADDQPHIFHVEHVSRADVEKITGTTNATHPQDTGDAHVKA